jgi:hypothetical protein
MLKKAPKETSVTTCRVGGWKTAIRCRLLQRRDYFGARALKPCAHEWWLRSHAAIRHVVGTLFLSVTSGELPCRPPPSGGTGQTLYAWSLHWTNCPGPGPQSFLIKHFIFSVSCVALVPVLRNTQQLVGGGEDGRKPTLHKVSLIIDTPVSLTHARHWSPPGQSRPHLTHLEVKGGRNPLPPFTTTSPTQRGTAIPTAAVGCYLGTARRGEARGKSQGVFPTPPAAVGGARELTYSHPHDPCWVNGLDHQSSHVSSSFQCQCQISLTSTASGMCFAP